MYEIDKNVKMPEERSIRRDRGNRKKYPWSEMRVGDSFLVPYTDISRDIRQLTHGGIQWAQRRGLDWQFAQRRLENGIRVWRTK